MPFWPFWTEVPPCDTMFCCPATFPSPPPEIHSLSNRWRCNVSFHLMRRHQTSTVWENTISKIQIQYHKTENKLCFLFSTILNILNQFYFANRVVHFPSLEVSLYIFTFTTQFRSHLSDQIIDPCFQHQKTSILILTKCYRCYNPPCKLNKQNHKQIQLHIGSEAPNLDKLMY